MDEMEWFCQNEVKGNGSSAEPDDFVDLIDVKNFFFRICNETCNQYYKYKYK